MKSITENGATLSTVGAVIVGISLGFTYGQTVGWGVIGTLLFLIGMSCREE